MNTSSSRHEGGSKRRDSKDRLSELPDEILVHILSFLPIVDAVRTVLIRTFGNRWTLLPSLNFFDKEILTAFWPSINELSYEDSTRFFVNFVRNVLLFHKKVTMDTFKLRFYSIDMNHGHEVAAWLSFAIDRKVKHLKVTDFFGKKLVPQCVFTSQSLVTLRLHKFRVVEPLKVHMGSLRKLSLRDVEMSNELFNEIIQGCPSLQEVALTNVARLNKLRFTAPNIQKLRLCHYSGLLDCPNLKILDIRNICQLQMVDLSSIREVDIRFCEYLHVSDACLENLCHAEVFKFSDRGFLLYSIFNGHDFPVTRWKRLHIDSRLCSHSLILGICKLLRSSPYLEEIIYTDFCSDLDIRCNIDLDSLELSCPMLRNVTIRGYKLPCHGLLRLAGLLLKSSVMLEKMVILPSRNKFAAVDVHKFLKQLVSFQKASNNARVIFGLETY